MGQKCQLIGKIFDNNRSNIIFLPFCIFGWVLLFEEQEHIKISIQTW